MGNIKSKKSHKKRSIKRGVKRGVKRGAKKRHISYQKDLLKYKVLNYKYHTFEDLEKALRDAGVEASELIVGVDFTKSNTWQGGKPFYDNDNLHSLYPYPNPYQQVLSIIARALAPFDTDQQIPAYGFGDATTTNKGVFSFVYDGYGNEALCHKLDGVLIAYNKILTDIENKVLQLAGPTNFAPLINKAISIVQAEKSYHILLIVCDGVVTNKKETIKAIERASNYPLSIVCIGVGKGPWELMEKFDDDIPNRIFDNFQFVNYHKIMDKCENEEVEFAKHALQEIPDQFSFIRKHILEY